MKSSELEWCFFQINVVCNGECKERQDLIVPFIHDFTIDTTTNDRLFNMCCMFCDGDVIVQHICLRYQDIDAFVESMGYMEPPGTE